MKVHSGQISPAERKDQTCSQWLLSFVVLVISTCIFITCETRHCEGWVLEIETCRVRAHLADRT